MGLGPSEQLLGAMGLHFGSENWGCCGMAGSFGYEREKYAMSRAIGERHLLPAVRDADRDTVIVADGFSCRSQIAHGTNRRAMHTAQVLEQALHAARGRTQGG
jgi:Fe-S oxidoreductase